MCSVANAAVEIDADHNGATDISKGGTNATTAASARTALGVPATAATLVGDCTVGPCLDGTSDGGNIIKLWAGTGSYWTALQGGAPAANRSWRLPIAAPPVAGATQVVTMDEYGQMAFMGLPGTSGYVLSSTDAGVLSWVAGGSGGYTNLTSFVDQTAWRVFYSNTAGDVTELALGADGTYLKSNGATSAPTWATPSGTMAWPAGAGIAVYGGSSAWGTSLTLATTVGATGVDTALVTEQGIREAINALPTVAGGTGITITANGGGAGIDTINVTASTYQAYDANMISWPSTISATEVGYLNGLTEALSTSLSGKQAADADLTTWAGVTPSANGQSLVSAANYAAMRTLLDLEAGTDFNAYDADLADLADGSLTASKVAGSAFASASKTTTYTIGTDSADEAYGGTVYVTSATTITAPSVTAGMNFAVVTIGNIAVSLDVNASDKMILDGVTLADGDKATNSSKAGDTIVCQYYSADGWYCWSSTVLGGHWTDGN